MSSWRIGAAKQQFSEVIRRSRDEPQRIYNRNRLVAAVVSPDDLGRVEKSKPDADVTLADLFDEFRRICAEEGFELPLPERRNREVWLDTTDEHEEREGARARTEKE